MTYRNVKKYCVNSMIVRRSTIRNQDYLVISSFAERLFVRDIKTYIFHIRALLTVMHRSVVLRRKQAVLRAAMTPNAKNAKPFSASASDIRNIASIRRSNKWKRTRKQFLEQARMRVTPLFYLYRTFRLRIYKYMLVCASKVGAYVPAAEERIAAMTRNPQSGTIKCKYFVMRNKQVDSVREQLDGTEKGNTCLCTPWGTHTMLFTHALSGRQHGSEAMQTLETFVWRVVYANLLQRKALYYTIFNRNWRRGFASLPVKRQIYTVLRSPHTDKKSREQFKHEYRRKIKSYPSFVSILTKRYIADKLAAGLGIKSKQTQMVNM